MDKKKLVYAAFLVFVLASAGIVSAFVIDEWLYDQPFGASGDSILVAHHRHAENGPEPFEYREFVANVTFHKGIDQGIIIKDDGRVFVEGKECQF